MNKEVSIKCPNCERVVATATIFERSYTDPHFSCKTKGCGMKGRLEWTRVAENKGVTTLRGKG